MISTEKELKLIAIYLYICDLYEKELCFTCQRFSNNANPQFTDQEIMAIYLFAGSKQHYFQIKEIYCFAKDYLLSWFPKLPSYQAFNIKLNLLSETVKTLTASLIDSFKPDDCSNTISMVDSMPLITCSGKNRIGKVVRKLLPKDIVHRSTCIITAVNFIP